MADNKNAFNTLKYLLFIVVFMSVFLKTTANTIYLFTDSNSELVVAEWEEDSDEEEEQADSKDEKIEHQIIYNIVISPFYSIVVITIQSQVHFWEFNFDIHTPPPEFV